MTFPLRSLVCVFGASVCAQSWQQPSLVNAPVARNSSAAAFDVYRGQTLLFGGYVGSSTPAGDTWEYDGITWMPRFTLTQPSPRWGHGMVFDTRRGCVVLFGGYGPGGALNDTWEWNGLGWTHRTIANPPQPRSYFGMAYDAVRGVVVLVGGLAYGSIANGTNHPDTWEYDGVTWSHRTSLMPVSRCVAACVWDETRRETLLFGGHEGNQVHGDLWAWNGTTWSLRVANGPSPRQAAAFAFDGNCGRAVLHGGSDASFTTNYGDSWAWDGLQWTQIPNAQPSPRHGANLVHDSQRGAFVLWGGRDAVGFRNDTWELGASCARTMVTLASPVLGQNASFRYDYPVTSTGSHFCWTVITPRFSGTLPIVVLGLPSIGGCNVDLFNQLAAPGTMLDASGRSTTTVAIPANPVFTGFQFDVQSVDIDLQTLTIRWASNDREETTLATSAGLPVAGFTATPASGAAPLTVAFTNTSTLATSYSWDFGDGTVSELANPPAKTYVGGTYTVSLAAMGPTGASFVQNQIVVTGASALPVASFTATPTLGNAPLLVQFTDTSTQGPTSWQWDFENDGIVDSTQRNPVWTYANNGVYAVRLVVTNFLGSGSVTRNHLVHVGIIVPNPALAMVAIAPGTFLMGSAAVGEPVHQVTLSAPFWIGKYEVTQAQYLAVMGLNPSGFPGAQRPVESMNWFSARAYCAALTVSEVAAGRVPMGYEYRLPTEAEWEYCCRAGTTTEWHTGASLTFSQANFFGALSTPAQYWGQTAVVGSYPPNAFGLHDMHGNVSEMCLDSYAPYSSAPVTDPFVTGSNQRISRGGDYGFNSPATTCRSASRYYTFDNSTWMGKGFRVVLAPALVP